VRDETKKLQTPLQPPRTNEPTVVERTCEMFARRVGGATSKRIRQADAAPSHCCSEWPSRHTHHRLRPHRASRAFPNRFNHLIPRIRTGERHEDACRGRQRKHRHDSDSIEDHHEIQQRTEVPDSTAADVLNVSFRRAAATPVRRSRHPRGKPKHRAEGKQPASRRLPSAKPTQWPLFCPSP
jgi:hypothetical protein